jgi:putative PIN family toxin of toxin-antitoxin system
VVRVVADTNIYISALHFGGTPRRFLETAQAGAFELVISDAILDEIGKVLRTEKFVWPEEEIAKARHALGGFTERARPDGTLLVITAEPEDNRILECADAGNADVIVSGDKHLLQLKQYSGMPVLKVTEFLQQLVDFCLSG